MQERLVEAKNALKLAFEELVNTVEIVKSLSLLLFRGSERCLL